MCEPSQLKEQVTVLQEKNKGGDDLRRVVEQQSREIKELKDKESFEIRYEESMLEITELKEELADTHMANSRMRKQQRRAQSESAASGALSPHLDKKPRISDMM